ncbi:hypothetical protein RclHR1_14230002 [Rhizophagus clarus]|uniref:Uncharacterized protein n=1 Tax=Rhizophagus clarus TaxID=94130 RepID=A0A2Z6R4T3_9GLOM|nr:hypothetical protein RclHR1_14230002 [Rhizophagus clarus]
MSEPVIYIDPQKAHNLDQDLALQKLYYRLEGYYQTAEKLQIAYKKAGYDFTIIVIKKWLNCIQTLNKAYQSDTTPMPHNKVVIAERNHQEFEKHTYFWQYAEDFHLPLTNKSRAWFKGLHINDDIYNNTPTQLIGMSPNEAIKRALKGKKIIARPSVKHRKPIGYNESLLLNYTEVQHLLKPGELEGRRRRATDCN